MSSFYEPDSSFLFDPSSQMEETPSSFLSFSSFAALANIASSPWSLSSWDSDNQHHDENHNTSKRNPRSSFCGPSSDYSHSPATSDEADLIHGVERSFEPITPHLPAGHIFRSLPNAHAGSSKLSVGSAEPCQRSETTISDPWTSPRTPTPTLLSKSSIESIAAVTSIPRTYNPSSVSPSPLRTTSNPVLGSTYRKPVKNVSSMPALKEEEQLSAEAFFEALELDDVFGISSTSSNNVQQNNGADDNLTEDFGWVFSDYGLGSSSGSASGSGSGSGSSTGIVPADSTIFAAFQTEDNSSASTSQWVDNTIAPDAINSSYYGFNDPVQNFTIDPMEFMGSMATTASSSGSSIDDHSNRPWSAPGLAAGMSSGQMLSIPMSDMSRSVSSDDVISQSGAPSHETFPYFCQPSQEINTYSKGLAPQSQPIVMPPTPTQSRRSSKAGVRQPGLSVQVQNVDQSTYRVPSNLLPTPTSATFGQMSSQQPLPMSRSGSQPLPIQRKSSAHGPHTNGPAPEPIPMPPVIARAAAIVAMQEAKQEAQRQELRRQAAARRVGMAEASVLQPYGMIGNVHPVPNQITGWNGMAGMPSTMGPSYSTDHRPVVNVHPPPMTTYSMSAQSASSHSSNRIHPPPHPGSASSSRPIARMPSTPTRSRKVSASPQKRTPSKKRAAAESNAAGGGGFSWGNATFINFTSDDAEKLLTGVAPSGSQSKRKREEEARQNEEVMMGDRKRSRSGDSS